MGLGTEYAKSRVWQTGVIGLLATTGVKCQYLSKILGNKAHPAAKYFERARRTLLIPQLAPRTTLWTSRIRTSTVMDKHRMELYREPHADYRGR